MSWVDALATRQTRSHLPGLEFEPFPYLSALSILLRVTRLMSLEPSEWYPTVGVRFSSAGPDLLPGKVTRARFETAVGLAGTRVSSWWTQEAWSPLRTNGALDRDRLPVRWCPECATFGYHTMLFQLPSIDRCPWHDCALLEHCPSCKKLGSTLIDSAGQIGRCDCGFDWLVVNDATVRMWKFPTAKSESWLSTYLSWADEQRERRFLVVPERASQWRAGFAVLAEPPDRVRHPCGRASTFGTRLACFGDVSTEDPPNSQFWGLCALADARPLTLVSLPAHTHQRLATITHSVIAQLPRLDDATVEVVAMQQTAAATEPHPHCTTPAERLIAPHCMDAEGSVWLDLSVMDSDTLQVCGLLLEHVTSNCDPLPYEADRSRQAARTDALGRIGGRGLLAAALEEILLAGYYQGLTAVMRKHRKLGSLDEWWLPVAEFTGSLGRISRLRVCWVQTPVPGCCRKTPSPPVPPLPRREVRRPMLRLQTKRVGGTAARR